jgi:hypothetical protein
MDATGDHHVKQNKSVTVPQRQVLHAFFLSYVEFRGKRKGHKNKRGFCPEVGWGEVAQTMYTHVSKCKSDKIKGVKKKKDQEIKK